MDRDQLICWLAIGRLRSLHLLWGAALKTTETGTDWGKLPPWPPTAEAGVVPLTVASTRAPDHPTLARGGLEAPVFTQVASASLGTTTWPHTQIAEQDVATNKMAMLKSAHMGRERGCD